MQCAAFSLPCLLSLWSTGSRRVGFCSQGTWAQQLGHVGSAVGVRGLRSWGTSAQQLGCMGSAAGAQGLSSWGMWAQKLQLPGSRAQAQYLWHAALAAWHHVGSSWTRETNPCLLHWQVDSSPLRHQGSPMISF